MTDTPSETAAVAIVLNRDLLFGSRIRSALAGLGLEGQFARDTAQFIAALESLGERAAIGIIDMNGEVEWDEVAAALAQPETTTPILAFGPHVDVENRRAAKAAGVARVVSNGQFHEGMASFIDRYRRR